MQITDENNPLFAAGSVSGDSLWRISNGFDFAAQQLDAIGVTLLRSVATNVNGTGIRVAHRKRGYKIPPDLKSIRRTAQYGNRPVFSRTSTPMAPPMIFPIVWGLNRVTRTPWREIFTESRRRGHQRRARGQLRRELFLRQHHRRDISDEHQRSGGKPKFHFWLRSRQVTVAQQQKLDSAYDDYAAQYNTLFVSGAGNGGPGSGSVAPPSTCYNGISVGAYG